MALAKPSYRIIDPHVHVWKADPKYPWAKETKNPPKEDASAEMLLELMKTNGVERTVLVQVIHYRWDNSYTADVLKKYPKEYAGYTFVSDWKEEAGERDFEFKGRTVLLNLNADNKPNLAGGPHWTAELHAVWNLDTGKFDKVDFKPGEISDRPWLK